MTATNSPKKLIEVALPLDEINAACKADKDRKTGTIRNIHKWFAPMPLPAWRALIFAALVDDPAEDEKRAYLLDLIKRLVANGADPPDAATLDEAQKLIVAQFPGGVPTVMDPFCGGGSTLAEAQRLGLPTFGSDLNPVPALITRTMTELLPKVYGQQPLHPEKSEELRKRTGRRISAEQTSLIPLENSRQYSGYDGLVQDVVHYGRVVLRLVKEIVAGHYSFTRDETPVAWLWARTARCPNPACGIETVLATTWWLNKKAGELAWIEATVTDAGQIDLSVRDGQLTGEAPSAPKIGDGVFACLACNGTLTSPYLRSEGQARRLGLRMVAVAVTTKDGRRKYRAPSEAEIHAAVNVPQDVNGSAVPINVGGQGIRVGLYGLVTWDEIFTARQRLTLVAFADQVARVRERIVSDGGSQTWADAVVTILGLAVGRLARYGSTQSQWRLRGAANAKAESVFSRADLPMMWDFAETYFDGGSVGDWTEACVSTASSLKLLVQGTGTVVRADARTIRAPKPALVATDPPYFDAIGYADLSDFFYIWHRRALRDVHPDLYITVAAPKQGELTASPAHHGGSRIRARDYFIEGFTETFHNLQQSAADGLPILVVYASKEQKAGAEEETRWSSILTAMVQANLEITGTWPIHGTGSTRMRGLGSNAVATYVVMVCRPRSMTAGTCSLLEFNRALRRELKTAVRDLQASGILPVDLAQAAMGPGMQVYSRYRKVEDQTGKHVPVEHALRLINAALGEVLDEQEGELDPFSRFAVAWWDKHSWQEAAFGEADQLARPQGISVDDIIRAEVAEYPKPGFVSLLGNDGLDRDWKPSSDKYPTAWEAVHHLADRLISGGGELEAGQLMRELGTLRDPAQALVYRLHNIAAKKGRTKDQERYNALIGSWSDLLAVAASHRDGLF